MANKSKDQTFGAEHKVSIGGTTMLVVSNSLKAEHTWSEPSENGFIGTQRPANTGRQVVKTDVKGTIGVRPSYTLANTLLPLFMDGASSPYTPADTPSGETTAIVCDRGTDVYTYAACWFNSVTISGSENEPLTWELDLLGTTESNAGTVAALTIPDKMLFSDLSLSINANAYFPISFSWKLDYAMNERFHNSVTRSSVASNIPLVTMEFEFDDNADTWADLFALAGTDTAIEDVNLVFADGSNTLSILHPEVSVMNESKFSDADGIDAHTNTLMLKAWLASGETDLFSITYA